jgi:transcriptional regulator with XRE-family HTH domain
MVALTPLRSLHDVGLQLRALRLQQNRTQHEISTAVGLSPRALSALESGSASDLRLQTLFKLLRYYRSQLMLAPESPLPTLAELDFQRQQPIAGEPLTDTRHSARARASGRRGRPKS